MRLPVNRNLPLAALFLLSACGNGGANHVESASSVPVTGPAADYPVVVGEPFTVDGVLYTPKDTLNYDAVGYASVGSEGGGGVTAAHRTLPLPCYVEVTSLDTGRTILVRLERRGPMSGSQVLELSPGAAAQLGVNPGSDAPIRVRRVNPPEAERALLRTGQQAPARMDTPKSLVEVLRRRLSQQPGLLNGAMRPLPPTAPEPQVDETPPPAKPADTKPAVPASKAKSKVKPVVKTPAKPEPKPEVKAEPKVEPKIEPKPEIKPEPKAKSEPKAKPESAPKVAAAGSSLVQVAAFSDKGRADAAAAKLGGQVSPAGKLWRVRLGPFADQAAAKAALAKAKAAGYSDARIQRAD